MVLISVLVLVNYNNPRQTVYKVDVIGIGRLYPVNQKGSEERVRLSMVRINFPLGQVFMKPTLCANVLNKRFSF